MLMLLIKVIHGQIQLLGSEKPVRIVHFQDDKTCFKGSNIIIYSAQPEHAQLRELIAENAPAVSALSYLEVLGYHLLTDQQRQYFEERFFTTLRYMAKTVQQIH
jgi:hypothetical protein